MELIDVKKILRNASVEVDIQGHGMCICIFEGDFERVAIELFNNLTIQSVSQRNEVLKHYNNFVNIQYHGVSLDDSDIKDFEYWLNCV
tara:strand:+ start:434 stop:697 length:264 start_codon:yes stop_codon:yes gene_type:complete